MSQLTRVPSGTPATDLLTREGVAFTAHGYRHDPRAESFGLEAARELGIDPDRILKTLIADLDGALVVGVVPVSAHLNLKALARVLSGRRAAMADVGAAERATGYVAGGISPLGQRRTHPTAVDETVELWDTVFVSGGRRGLSLELAPADLLRLTAAQVGDIAR